MGQTMTRARVAEIEFEKATADYGQPADGSWGEGPATQVQPKGVRLDNDGCYYHWISTGAPATLTHDGVGWRMDAEGWDAGHARRLADASRPRGSFISWLPLAGGGRVELSPGTVYELRFGFNEQATMSVLWLAEIS